MSSRKLRVSGKRLLSTGESTTGFDLKHSIQLSLLRDQGEDHDLDIQEDDILEFVFDDETRWMGSPESLHELFPEMATAQRSEGGAERLPLMLSTDSTDRSVKSIALKLLNVFGKKALGKGIQELAESLEHKLLDNQVGVYQVTAGFELVPFKSVNTEQPVLLFIHGTGSSSLGSFGELKGTSLWEELQKQYGNNILAFQHQTLTLSPLENVLQLAQQLPDLSRLHIVTHSRGGLVGDVLARFCADEQGFSEAGIDLLKRVEREQDIQTIRSLQALFAKRKLRLEKYIRVACPARGTSLLSKRLDYFFNVSMNLISLGAGSILNPVLEGFKALLTAIIDSKSNVDVLPGLEAMCPTSPFLKALNAPEPIAGQVCVISGNANYSLSLKALVVIVSKLVFKGDNDFVVNTPSMLQGAKRQQGTYYFFDEGAEVNHFNYFRNKKTQEAILLALQSRDGVPALFSKYEAFSSEDLQRGVFGLEGGSVFMDEVSGKRPIAIVIPGIMGSNLGRKGTGIWLNYFRLLFGGLSDLEDLDGSITATSLIKTSYKKLCKNLSDDHDVVTFPFDWRKSVTDCAQSLDKKIRELLGHKQPIRILAHSMGGVLAREFILRYDKTWKALNVSPGFRMILLGTPWMGSYRIPHVFAGRDSIIKQLNTLDTVHSMEELIQLFTNFPGILNLLPVRKQDINFGDPEVWKQLQKASQLQWNIPNNKTIESFAAFRDFVQEHEANIDYANIRYLAGKDDSTPAGYTILQGQLQFSHTAKGDQSVTWEAGIPEALRKQQKVYYSNITHGALANDESLWPAIKQLMETGHTDLLTRNEPQVSETLTRSKVQLEHEDIFDTDEVSAIHRILGLPMETSIQKSQPTLQVSVSNGDLMFSSYPVIIGHFKGDGIVSAERVADNYLKGALSVHHSLNDYPGEVGSHLIKLLEKQEFNGACIIGLGDVDQLTFAELSGSVEKGVTRYLLDYCRKNNPRTARLNGISTLLIGTDYGGLSLDSSIRAILQGINQANQKIESVLPGQVHLAEHVEFVELFEDRALQCFYNLKRIVGNNADELKVSFKQQKIKTLMGKRKRLMMESKSDWWQRLTVLVQHGDNNLGTETLSFFSSTSLAREERKELQSNLSLIEGMIESISTYQNWSPETAKTIFELLVPNEFKENIRRQMDILWVLDEYTAAIPWELFQTELQNTKPLCVQSGMIRQLATGNYKENTTPVNNNQVLVIGDPQTQGYVSALPGAEKEAREVTARFADADYRVESQIKAQTPDIITALFKQSYKIIHISAHGHFDRNQPAKNGMIIGKEMYLTPAEFNQLDYTPELVFVNCCHLGKVDTVSEQLYASRYKLAANIGTQLIQQGVKAVIAAGWAVDDAAALEFARVFYDSMFNGYEFGRAVQKARQTIFNNFPKSNTWGAFQCYGDPFYKLRVHVKRTPKSRNYIISHEAEHDVENLISKAEIAYRDTTSLAEELDEIVEALQSVKTPELLERAAMAYVEVNEPRKAIALFNEVIHSERATYSVRTLERYNNILAKQILADFMEEQKQPRTERKTKSERRDYLAEMDKVIDSLSKLLQIAETAERYSLIGSAYKRKAALVNTVKARIHALKQSAKAYYHAHARNQEDSMYSLLNWLEIEFFLVQLGEHEWGKEIKAAGSEDKPYSLPDLAQVIEAITQRKVAVDELIEREQHNYWDMVSRANASLCLWLLQGFVDDQMVKDEIAALYKQTWENIGSKNKKMLEISHFQLLIAYSKWLDHPHLTLTLEHLMNDLEKSL